MSNIPQVSFIVASYNYAKFIGTTIKSILNQTITDFEIVVIDDVSADESMDVIRTFIDPRIRVYVNDRNMGPAWTYNRAASLSRGTYICYLDADDWIDPQKTELQLEHFRQNPDVDILGTYVKIFDKNGNRHPLAQETEQWTNQPHDLNRLETWIVQNRLSAPSVMFPRALHDRIGLRDPAMIRAADYELWTRALRQGCRFDLVQAPLLCYRVHTAAASAVDPSGSFLEISYLLQQNLLPMITAPETLHLVAQIVSWTAAQEQFLLLPEVERYRLLAIMMNTPQCSGFADYKKMIRGDHIDQALTTTGRRLYAALLLHPSGDYDQTLLQDLQVTRDWHQRRSAFWQQNYDQLSGELDTLRYEIARLTRENDNLVR